MIAETSPPGSSVHGILQARILEWVAIPFSKGSSLPRSPALQMDSLTSDSPGKPSWLKVKVTQSCLTLCDPMDYIVLGILQARILEWISFPFSRDSSQPRDQVQASHIAGRFFTSWATKEAQEYWSIKRSVNELEVEASGGHGNETTNIVHTERRAWDFPGCPVVKTPCFHCRGSIPGPTCYGHGQKKQRRV